MLDIPTLNSERLRLEPLTAAHEAGMFESWSQPKVCQFSGPAVDKDGGAIRLPAGDVSDSNRIIEYFEHAQARGTGFRWAVVLAGENVFAGTVGFNAIGRSSEIAFHLHPTFWGRGFMREACVLAIEWCRTQICASVVVAHVDPRNSASVRLLHRLGFERDPGSHGDAERYTLVLDGG